MARDRMTQRLSLVSIWIILVVALATAGCTQHRPSEMLTATVSKGEQDLVSPDMALDRLKARNKGDRRVAAALSRRG